MLCEQLQTLRTDSVLDSIGEVYQKTKGGPSLYANIEKALLGTIIIRRYNKKTQDRQGCPK